MIASGPFFDGSALGKNIAELENLAYHGKDQSVVTFEWGDCLPAIMSSAPQTIHLPMHRRSFSSKAHSHCIELLYSKLSTSVC